MKAGSLRALPKAVTPENAPVSDRNGNFQEFLRTFEIASFKLKSEANPQSSSIVPSLTLMYFMINGLRVTRASDTRCGALSSECGTCLTCLTDLVCRRYIKSAAPARIMREYRRPQGEKRRATHTKVSNPIFL